MRPATPMGVAMAVLLGDGPAGVQPLADEFAAKGLDAVFASWTGDGPPRKLTPRMLRRVLGWRRLELLAALAGVPPDEFLIRMTRLLPAAVRRVMMPPPRPMVWFAAVS